MGFVANPLYTQQERIPSYIPLSRGSSVYGVQYKSLVRIYYAEREEGVK